MPPKAKFTKKQIVTAALSIIREKGIDALTARELGAKLGSSARPVFTVFQNMQEVITEATKEAKELYKGYVKKGLTELPAFKGVGMSYIRFARQEPKLFQLLFMTEGMDIPEFAGVLPVIEDSFEEILASVQDSYQLDQKEALKLYQHMWIYTHGAASLCATRVCAFEEEEIGRMLTEVCTGLLKEMKRK